MKEKRYIIVYLNSYMCFGYGDCKVIGITDDITLWSRMEFFEINEIQADGTVVKIKDCKDWGRHLEKGVPPRGQDHSPYGHAA